MDSMDIPDVANVEVIGLSPSGSPVSDDLVYQELQCTAQSEFKGYTYAGKSPDQGYESDYVCQVAYGNDFLNEVSSGNYGYYENTQITDALTATATSYNFSSSPLLTSANTAAMPGSDSFGSMKVESSEDLTGWPAVASVSLADVLQTDISVLDFIDLTDTSQSIDESHQASCGAQQAIYSTPAHQMTYSSHQALTIKCEQQPWHYPPTTAQGYQGLVVQSRPDPGLEISDDDGMEEIYSPHSKKQDQATRVTPKRRRKSTKQPILWKFLLDALNNPGQYGHMIQWVNIEEGAFQFNSQHKEELSKQWGLAKRNRCTMTYQKMARAMRNYINRGEVLSKVKKKLQYTFLPDFYEGIKGPVLR